MHKLLYKIKTYEKSKNYIGNGKPFIFWVALFTNLGDHINCSPSEPSYSQY